MTHFFDLKSVCFGHFCPPGTSLGGPPEARNLVFPKENQGSGPFPRVAPGMRFLGFPPFFPREGEKAGTPRGARNAETHIHLCRFALSVISPEPRFFPRERGNRGKRIPGHPAGYARNLSFP